MQQVTSQSGIPGSAPRVLRNHLGIMGDAIQLGKHGLIDTLQNKLPLQVVLLSMYDLLAVANGSTDAVSSKPRAAKTEFIILELYVLIRVKEC